MAHHVRPLLVFLLFVSAVHPVAASNDARSTFVKRWEGRLVAVKQTMFTLVYDQRGRLGTTSRKREGLQVVGLSGTSLQFKGRFDEEDIVEQNPDRVMAAIRETYIRSYTFDIGSYHRVDPLVIERFEPGARFVVRDVRVDDDSIHLAFNVVPEDRKGDLATELTVHWDVPLSRSFTEAPLVENLIRQFVEFEGPPRP